jgi:hypothetical protein
MPRLTPDDIVVADKILAQGLNEEPKKFVQKDLDVKLKKHQMTVDSCLETLSNVMHFSRKEQNKIVVAKLGLELNGVLKEGGQEENKTPTIQFVFTDSNVQLNGLFNPQR